MICPECRGRGTVVGSWGDVPIEMECGYCMGRGQWSEEEELIGIIEKILQQEFTLPPVEEDPEGDASVYFSGFDDGLKAVKHWLKGDHSMLEARLNK